MKLAVNQENRIYITPISGVYLGTERTFGADNYTREIEKFEQNRHKQGRG